MQTMTKTDLFTETESMNSQTCLWVSSPAMASQLGIHHQTLLRLRRHHHSPFKEGSDFRWSGISDRSNLQWHTKTAEESFTSFKRMPSSQVETYTKQGQQKP